MNRYKKALLREILFHGLFVLKNGYPNTIRGGVDGMYNIYRHLLRLFQQRKRKDKRKSIIKSLREEYNEWY